MTIFGKRFRWDSRDWSLRYDFVQPRRVETGMFIGQPIALDNGWTVTYRGTQHIGGAMFGFRCMVCHRFRIGWPGRTFVHPKCLEHR